MKKILDVCKRLRILQIGGIVLLLMIVRYCIINSILSIGGFSIQMPTYLFVLLVVALGALVLAGYTIDDYFDTKKDVIVRPNQNIVKTKIERITAIKLHVILNFVAIILGGYVSYKTGVINLTVLYILATGLMWFYSTSYKKNKIFGQFIISLMVAFIPIIGLLYEIPFLNGFYEDQMKADDFNFLYLFNWLGIFSLALFLGQFAKNLIKANLKDLVLYDETDNRLTNITIASLYMGLILVSIYVTKSIFETVKWAQAYIIVFSILLPLVTIINLCGRKNIKSLKIQLLMSKAIVISIALFGIIIAIVLQKGLL